jgi:hypothetical protein
VLRAECTRQIAAMTTAPADQSRTVALQQEDERLNPVKAVAQNGFPDRYDSDRSTEIVEIEIESAGRSDLTGLLAYLGRLEQNGVHFQEATYIGNKWSWQGIIPFEHYGFVFSTTSGEYLSLDFGRKGIVWDIFDDYPDYPDGTFLVERYRVDTSNDMRLTRTYCQDTRAFIFMIYDCQTWSKGLIQHLKMARIGEPMHGVPIPQDARPKQNRGIYGYVSCM